MLLAVLWALVLAFSWSACLRVAWRWVGGGWAGVATAASLLGTIAALVPLTSGLAGLGAGPLALTGLTLAVTAPAFVLAGRPGEGTLEAAGAGWGSAAAAGTGVAAALGVAGVLNPVQIADPFHLSQIVRWLHEGHPGSPQPMDYQFPNQGLAMANELVLTWGIGISRSLAPAALLTAALLALLAGSLVAFLHNRGAPPRWAAAGGGAAFAAAAVNMQVDAFNTDLPSVAWLAAAAALATDRTVVRRVGPVLLAAGLAAGAKPTVALISLVLVAVAGWERRHELGAVELAAAAGALALAAPWPLRSLIEHGSPLWPISSMGIGDPVPYIQSELQTSFIEAPRASVEMYWEEARTAFLRMLAILGAGVAATLLTRRRDARAAGVLVAVAVVLWAGSPLSGRGEATGFADSYLRYLVAPATLAALAAGLAAAGGGRAARGLLVAVAAICVVSLPLALRPSLLELAAAVTLGAAAGLAGRRLHPRVLAGAAVAAVAAVSVVADTTYAPGPEDRVYAYLSSQPAFAEGGHPVITDLTPEGRWSGPDLRHDLILRPAGRPCGRLRERVARAWVVVYAPRAFGEAFAGFPAAARPGPAEPCLRGLRPRYDDGTVRIYSGLPR